MFHSYNRILSALAVIVDLMLTVTGCGEKSSGVGIGNQAEGESELSKVADMTGMMSGTDAAELSKATGVTDDEISERRSCPDMDLGRLFPFINTMAIIFPGVRIVVWSTESNSIMTRKGIWPAASYIGKKLLAAFSWPESL